MERGIATVRRGCWTGNAFRAVLLAGASAAVMAGAAPRAGAGPGE